MEKALGDFANTLYFFFLKMNLVFVSMGGQGKVLFGDSLVYSKGHILDAKDWEIPKHHFIHQQRWNSARRKKKISLGFPSSAAEFYLFNFNFTSGIPWEIPGGSLQ